VFVSKIATIVLGIIAILLGIAFEKQNIAYLVALTFSVAASANFPILLMSIYYGKMTTRGALIGGWLGLITATVLVIVGPTVWTEILKLGDPIFPRRSDLPVQVSGVHLDDYRLPGNLDRLDAGRQRACQEGTRSLRGAGRALPDRHRR